jgi:hypothetical protein
MPHMVCGGVLDLSLHIVGMKLDIPWNTTSRKMTGHFANFKEIPKKFRVLNFEVKKPVNILGLFPYPSSLHKMYTINYIYCNICC